MSDSEANAAGQRVTDDPATDPGSASAPRELPQSLGMVAHIWASKREAEEPAAPAAIDVRDAPEVISLLEEPAAVHTAD